MAKSTSCEIINDVAKQLLAFCCRNLSPGLREMLYELFLTDLIPSGIFLNALEQLTVRIFL